MDSGREQNYWPGFVDALSNVVLTLVFVIVIFVFALVMGANKVEQKMQEIVTAKEQMKQQLVAAQPSQELIEENKKLHERISQDAAEIAKLQEQVQATSKDHSQNGGSPGLTTASGTKDQGKDPSSINDAAESKGTQIDVTEKPNQKLAQGAVGIQTSENKITLLYPPAVAEMDDKSAANLVRVLEDFKNKFGKHKISINSVAGKEPYSAAQRYAYYRAISVRNNLIAKGIAESNAITNHIVQPPTPEDGRVEIIFEH